MILTIKGTVCEVAYGDETDSLTVVRDKRKSKVKFESETGVDGFNVGDDVTITVERDGKLFDKKPKE